MEDKIKEIGKKDRINYELFIQMEQDKRLSELSKIPKTKLESKHINNLKFILDRQELLSRMQKSGVCAEIGVANGDFSKDIFNTTNPQKLHLIDSWDSERYGKELMNNVKSTFNTQIESGYVEVNRGFSTVVLQSFQDEYFDWVYIDTDHSYNTTNQELLICKDKVKDNGVIAGHDFHIGNWVTGYKYGVIEAVYEFCVLYNWEIIYLTSDIEYASFAIKRIPADLLK